MPIQQNALTLKTCKWCGGQFQPRRSTAQFCCASHRVSSFNAAARAATRDKCKEERSAISLGFDGRVGGVQRDFVGRTRHKTRGLRGWHTPIYLDAVSVANG